MHEVGEAGELVGVGRGQHPVAEVEDVARGGAAGLEHLGGAVEHHLGGGEDQGRVEVALHGRPPTRRTPSASGTRQSTPTTSAPASPIRPSSSPVPTPKWIRGTPSSPAAASTRADYGMTWAT